MPGSIDRHEVRRLVDEEDTQLVDVLPRRAFEHARLPGAVSAPLVRFRDGALEQLDPDLPVIVYCGGFLWDLSPRAAWRLEQLGFADVYDYAGGKEDWRAAGWPVEGHAADHPVAGDAAWADAPTCRLDDRVGDLAFDDRVRFVLVTDDERVVLGKVLPRHAQQHPDAPARDVMVEGPTTVRASEDLDGLAGRMEDADTSSVIVTSKEGQLVGVLGIDEAYAILRGDR